MMSRNPHARPASPRSSSGSLARPRPWCRTSFTRRRTHSRHHFRQMRHLSSVTSPSNGNRESTSLPLLCAPTTNSSSLGSFAITSASSASAVKPAHLSLPSPVYSSVCKIDELNTSFFAAHTARCVPLQPDLRFEATSSRSELDGTLHATSFGIMPGTIKARRRHHGTWHLDVLPCASGALLTLAGAT